MVKVYSGGRPAAGLHSRKKNSRSKSIGRRLKITEGIYNDRKKVYLRRFILFLITLTLLAIGAYGVFSV